MDNDTFTAVNSPRRWFFLSAKPKKAYVCGHLMLERIYLLAHQKTDGSQPRL